MMIPVIIPIVPVKKLAMPAIPRPILPRIESGASVTASAIFGSPRQSAIHKIHKITPATFPKYIHNVPNRIDTIVNTSSAGNPYRIVQGQMSSAFFPTVISCAIRNDLIFFSTELKEPEEYSFLHCTMPVPEDRIKRMFSWYFPWKFPDQTSV